MTIRQGLTASERRQFPIGARIRYEPGFGVYGYEDCLEADGRVRGVVLGYTPTRVQIEVTLINRGGATFRRAVNAAQLVRADAQSASTDHAGPPTTEGVD